MIQKLFNRITDVFLLIMTREPDSLYYTTSVTIKSDNEIISHRELSVKYR